MYIVYALITFAFWGTADLFYKMGNVQNSKYDHMKTGMLVGIVMGIHATIYLIINHVDFSFIDALKYLPISLCYISSMVIGYKGLKYLEVSLSSPVQNTSGVITSLLLILFFKEKLPGLAYVAFLLIFAGIISLSLVEYREAKHDRDKLKLSLKKNKHKFVFLTILFPICYCLLDGAGTFLDSIYLDKLELISEDMALVAYEYTFLIYAIIVGIILKVKGEKLTFKEDKHKGIAALLETAGQYFYVFAIANESTICVSIVGSYCILSFILGHLILKEKLSKKQYISIAAAIIGIVILSVLDV